MTPTPPPSPPAGPLQLRAAPAGRERGVPNKAFIDDAGTLSYGELADRVKRLAAACALGLKREERVLLLMQDGNDWPVSFLGAMYAGVVPVAVNTCSPPTTTPTCSSTAARRRCWCQGAAAGADRRADQVGSRGAEGHRLAPVAPLHPAEVEFEAFLAAQTPMAKPAGTGPTTPASGSTPRVPPVAPRARCTRTPTLLDGRALRQGHPRPAPNATSASPPPSSSSPTAWATR